MGTKCDWSDQSTYASKAPAGTFMSPARSNPNQSSLSLAFGSQMSPALPAIDAPVWPTFSATTELLEVRGSAKRAAAMTTPVIDIRARM